MKTIREPLYILFGSVSQFVRVSVLFVRVAESPFCNKRLQIRNRGAHWLRTIALHYGDIIINI